MLEQFLQWAGAITAGVILGGAIRYGMDAVTNKMTRAYMRKLKERQEHGKAH